MSNIHNEPTIFSNMTVDIRLCGSIPRQDLLQRREQQQVAPNGDKGAPCLLSPSALTSPGKCLNAALLAASNGPKSPSSTHNTTAASDSFSSMFLLNSSTQANMKSALQEKQNHPPFAQLLEPPPWAVSARGETRLEPIGETVGRQFAVDLTKRSCFRIGRSPNSDVQLMHATSSRRHALLFHHSNGSCYVVDCGSAHGTFVNGQRIAPPANGGVVIPHKVRRGALIRFGGMGAPSFVLKSFSFTLSDITDLSSGENPDTGELVRRNTRVNALGKTAADRVRDCLDSAILMTMSVMRKRSFDSLDSRDTLIDEPCSKRLRCSSPPPSPEEPPIHIVSPDLVAVTASKHRRVTFSPDPPQAFYPTLISPESSSAEEDNDSV